MIRLVSKTLVFLLIGVAIYTAEALLVKSNGENFSVVIEQAEVDGAQKAFVKRALRPPTAKETEALVTSLFDNRVLISEAIRLGLHKNDSVVRQRLEKNFDFLGFSDSHNSEYGRIQEEMIRKDAVVKRRLLERMKALLASRKNHSNPSESELRRFYNNEPERYSSSFQYRLSHRWELTGRADDVSSFNSPIDPEKFYSTNALRKILPQEILEQFDGVEQPASLKPVSAEIGTHRVEILEIMAPKKLAFELVEAKVKQDYYLRSMEDALNEYLVQVKPYYRLSIND